MVGWGGGHVIVYVSNEKFNVFLTISFPIDLNLCMVVIWT